MNLSSCPNRNGSAASCFSLKPRSYSSSVGSLSITFNFFFFFSTHTICIFFSMLWSVCRADLTGSAHPSQMLFPDNFGVNLEKMHCTCQFLRDENNKRRRWFFPWQNIFSKANRPPKSNRQDTAIFFSYLDKA